MSKYYITPPPPYLSSINDKNIKIYQFCEKRARFYAKSSARDTGPSPAACAAIHKTTATGKRLPPAGRRAVMPPAGLGDVVNGLDRIHQFLCDTSLTAEIPHGLS